MVDTNLSLLGIYSGLRLNTHAIGGLVGKTASITGQSGYRIRRSTTEEGLEFQIVSVDGAENVPDPANLVVSLEYAQTQCIDNVLCELSYSRLPKGSSIQFASDFAPFDMGRHAVEGSAKAVRTCASVPPIVILCQVRLWFPEWIELEADSSVCLQFFTQCATDGDRASVLQKFQINLVN